MIEDQDSNDTRFHTLHALSLAKSALEASEAETSSQSPNLGKMETDVSGTNLIFQSPVRERLQMFLQSSDLYDPEEVLDLIEVSEFWWEKVCYFF